MNASGNRTFDLDLEVTQLGTTGLLTAESSQMPNLTGTDDADLCDCLMPVITSLLEAKGEHVQLMTIDRSRGPRNIRVHVQTTTAQ
jgi:hypothetical protein